MPLPGPPIVCEVNGKITKSYTLRLEIGYRFLLVRQLLTIAATSVEGTKPYESPELWMIDLRQIDPLSLFAPGVAAHQAKKERGATTKITATAKGKASLNITSSRICKCTMLSNNIFDGLEVIVPE
jgi:hypothetical protein